MEQLASASLSRNCAPFHERFRGYAEISVHELGVIRLEQTDGEQSAGEELQSTVWDAGVTLSNAIAACWLPDFWHGKRVVECGSGCGLCGIVAAKLGAHCILTDLPPIVPLLARNARANDVTVDVCALDWEMSVVPAALVGADVILGSDITCFTQDLPLLARLLQRMAHSHTMILLAHHDRGDVDCLHEALRDGFTCERMHLPWDADGCASPIHVYRVQRRQHHGFDSIDAIDDDHAQDCCDARGSTEPSRDAVLAALRGDVSALKRQLCSLEGHVS